MIIIYIVEEDYSQDSFESLSDDKAKEVAMTIPKYDESEAFPIVKENALPDSPTPKLAGTVRTVNVNDEASVIVHKGVEESLCSVPLPPICKVYIYKFLAHASKQLQDNSNNSKIKSIVSTERTAQKKQKVNQSNNKENIISDLPHVILGYEKMKKDPIPLKFTDLKEARINRGKESYILV